MKTASGPAVLILSAGLLCCFGGVSVADTMSTITSIFGGTTTSTPSEEASKPVQVREASKPVQVRKHVRHKRHYVRHRSSRTALKSSDDRTDKVERSASKNAATEVAGNTAPASNAMPFGVANARAEIVSADTAAAAASAMTARANDNKQAAAENAQLQQVAETATENRLAQPNQLSDVDRAPHEESQPAAPPAVVATVEAQPRAEPVTAAATAESSTWEQTSLIGKIFIGFGALLTLASAARMFIA